MRKPQLFLFHFAGGNCYSFRFLTPLLPDFEVIPLELPGRGKRMNEPLLNEFDKAAEDLYKQILTHITGAPFLIYGHSMGAYLSLRVGNMLEKAGRYSAGIVVSGNAGPGINHPDDKKRYQLDRPAFIEEVKLLGGLPPELIENEELLSFFEPILRADFEIAERNELEEEPAIQANLFAIMGSQEDDVASINNWSRFTKGRFNAEVLQGDHFFIHRHPNRIAGIINAFYHGLPALSPSL
jgi:surfactin synthase thioesterase subunit